VIKRILNIATWRLLGPAVSFLSATLLIYIGDESQQVQIFNAYLLQIVINSFEYPYFIAAKKKSSIAKSYYLFGFVIIITACLALDYSIKELIYSFCLYALLIFFSHIFYLEENEKLKYVTIFGVSRAALINALIYLYVFDQLYIILLLCLLLVIANLYFRRNEVEYMSSKMVLMTIGASLSTTAIFALDRNLLHNFLDIKSVNWVVLTTSVVMMFGNIIGVAFVKVSQNIYSNSKFVLLINVLFILTMYLLLISHDLFGYMYIFVPMCFALMSPLVLMIQMKSMEAFLSINCGILIIKCGLYISPFDYINSSKLSILITLSSLMCILYVFRRGQGLER
jgi:hypothetical protein